MGVFDEILHSDQTLIKNENALDFDFVPKIIKHREREQRYVATCIKPLFQERNGKNCFIFGSPGIGKTVAIKHVLRDLEEQTDDVYQIYINCWQKNTTFKIILEICDILDYRFTQNKKTVVFLGPSMKEGQWYKILAIGPALAFAVDVIWCNFAWQAQKIELRNLAQRIDDVIRQYSRK